MNSNDAMDFLAEIVVNYDNLTFKDGLPIPGEKLDKWHDTLNKYYRYMEKV